MIFIIIAFFYDVIWFSELANGNTVHRHIDNVKRRYSTVDRDYKFNLDKGSSKNLRPLTPKSIRKCLLKNAIHLHVV